MYSPNEWEKLLAYALKQLDASGLPGDSWALGGGTVLMFHFEHRLSKDIDIFFNDKQLLGMVSPRINDAVELSLREYIEQDVFCKLTFPEGKVDFIYSHMMTTHAPQPRMLAGREVLCEDPVEIAVKKVYWRGDRFTPRDIFDLAVVYNAAPPRLLEALLDYPDKAAILAEQVKTGIESGVYDKWAKAALILPAGEPFLKKAPQDVSLLLETIKQRAEEQKRDSPGLVQVAAISKAPAEPDALVQYVISAGLDPRYEALQKTLPDSMNIEEVQKLLRQAAGNPEAWGVDEDAWKTWGENHAVGRLRTYPTPEGPKTEIVYDNF